MGGWYSTEPRPLEEPLVDIGRVAARSSSMYTCDRYLEDDFAIGEVMGHGRSGPVRCATNHADGSKYAVKSLKKTGLSSATREALRNEVQLLLDLDHEHIAKLHMVYETNEVLHLVMELLQGGELYNRLFAVKTFTEEVAADSMYQMLLAVSHCHSRNIVHRDLKLDNFVYQSNETNVLKLIDFGFAKLCDARTMMSEACGSLHYIAPEVLRQCYTMQVDMWSLGILSYMMLTGKPAFFGTETEILSTIKTGQPRYAKCFWELSWPAQSFIQSLMVTDPRSRMTAKQALEHPWIKGRHLRQHARLDSNVLDGPWTSTQSSHSRRATLCMVARSLSTEQAELVEQFLSMDIERNDAIRIKDFNEIVEETFHPEKAGNAENARLFRSITDVNNKNQEAMYGELLVAALEGQARSQKDAMHREFQAFDADSSGQISAHEPTPVLEDAVREVAFMRRTRRRHQTVPAFHVTEAIDWEDIAGKRFLARSETCFLHEATAPRRTSSAPTLP